MKNVLIAAVLLAAGGVGSASAVQMGTGRVAGTVKDTEGNPIQGAQVLAEGGGIELDAETDKNGRWAILGFRSGSYTFTFSAPGYQPQSYTANVKQMGKNPNMDIVLEKAQASGGMADSAAGELLKEANQLYDQKSYAEAIAKYEALLQENPDLYQIHFNIGMAYREMGELDNALASFQKVIEAEPGHAAALVNIGDVMVKQGKLDEAVQYFERAIAQAPTDEVLPFNVAEIYFNTGNAAKAIEFYQKASAVKPDWSEPYLKLGYAYLNTGDLDKAAESFQKVVEVAPDTPQAQMAQAALDSLKKN